MSKIANPEMLIWGILSIVFVVFGTASVIACWCCLYHACLKPCGVGPWGAGDAISSPDFDRSVNPISTRGDIESAAVISRILLTSRFSGQY